MDGTNDDEALQRAAGKTAGIMLVDIESEPDSDQEENRLVVATPFCDDVAFDWLIRLKAGEIMVENTSERIVIEARNANRSLTRETLRRSTKSLTMIRTDRTNPTCTNANLY